MTVGKGAGVRRVVRFLASVLVAVSSLPCGAAAPQVDDGWADMASTVFEHATTHDGLPHAIATGVTEGRDGAIWVATQDGVARWDGYGYLVYNDAQGLHGLPSAFIRTIAHDATGRVWVAPGMGGLARYDEAGDRFVVMDTATIVGIAPDADGGVWAASIKGLVHVDRHDVVRPAWPRGGQDTDALPDESIAAVLQDRQASVWIGSRSGLFVRHPDGRPGEAIALPGRGSSASGVSALFEDAAGAIWVGTRDHGVFVVEPASRHVRQVLPALDGGPWWDIPVTTFAEDGQGNVWIGTQTRGVVIADTRSLQSRRISHARDLPTNLRSNWVWGLHRDRAGQMWVASSAGLSRTVPQQAALLTLLPSEASGWSDPYELSMDVARDGQLVIGQKDGIEVLDPATRGRTHVRAATARAGDGPRGPSFHAIARAPHDRWFAGAFDGLYLFSKRELSLRRLPTPERRASRDVNALMVDGDTLWLGGSSDGLWKMSVASPQAGLVQVLSPAALGDPSVNVILGGPGGSLWIGTNRGIVRWQAGQPVERIDLASPTGDAQVRPTVNALLTDRLGRVWAGTSAGIAVLAGRDPRGAGTWRWIDQARGLGNNNVDALLMDDDGRVWASTDDGIAVIGPADLSPRMLHEKDGLAIPTYWAGSAARGADGQLFFGGLGGVTVVRPDRLRERVNSVPVVARGARIGRTVLAPGQIGDPGRLVVPPEARSFDVDFSAVDFANPQQIRYAYRLEGFDKDWRDADAGHRFASYTNLPPDHYTLRVKAADRFGTWSDRPLSIAVEIQPAWHQTWWFFVVKGLLAALAVAAIVALRGRYQRRRSRELSHLVDQRTAELTQAHARMEEMAYSDALTALPNRRMFGDQGQRLIASAGRQGASFALLLLDLDHFKQINDTHGHDAGDALLVEVARRLREPLRQSEFVARLGGDEFAVLLSDEADHAGIDLVCQRILQRFEAPVVFRGVALQASPSIGVAVFPTDGVTQDELYKAADVALYQAKRAGRRTWRFASRTWAHAGAGAPAPEADATS